MKSPGASRPNVLIRQDRHNIHFWVIYQDDVPVRRGRRWGRWWLAWYRRRG